MSSNANLEVGHGKYVAMNRQVWNSLPPDVQKVFEKEDSWGAAQDITLWTKADEDGAAFAKSQGVQFVELSPGEMEKFMAKIRPIQDKVAKEMDAKGYPGTALLKDVREAIANVSK